MLLTYRERCRDTTSTPLYAHLDTVCCFAAGCTCCAYRLVVQPPPSSAPNRRPGECLRAARRAASPAAAAVRPAAAAAAATTGLYAAGLRIATLGDGDLSFSLALARAGFGASMYATTYLTRAQLHAAYGESAVEAKVQELSALGAAVRHGVDASDGASMATLAADAGQSFDRVVWNFPCVGAGAGQDGQLEQIEENKELMRAFFRGVVDGGAGGERTAAVATRDAAAAIPFLTPSGEVHIAHKMKPPFGHWEMQSLADSRLLFNGGVVFDRALYPGYITRKVVGSKSFPTWDAQVLLWRLSGDVEGGGEGGGAVLKKKKKKKKKEKESKKKKKKKKKKEKAEAEAEAEAVAVEEEEDEEEVDVTTLALTKELRELRVATQRKRQAKKRKRKGPSCELDAEAPLQMVPLRTVRSASGGCRLVRVTSALLDRVSAALALKE